MKLRKNFLSNEWLEGMVLSHLHMILISEVPSVENALIHFIDSYISQLPLIRNFIMHVTHAKNRYFYL